MKDKLAKYIKDNLDNNIFFGKRFRSVAKAVSYYSEEVYDKECASVSEYIDNNKDENKFQKLLFKHIDSRNLKDSDVYNKVGIDRRLFSKIRSDSNYHPSKETVILLGIALELNEDEIEDLLLSASYSLPKNNNFDLIIRFCFKEGIYDLFTINDYLNDYKCKLLSV